MIKYLNINEQIFHLLHAKHGFKTQQSIATKTG